MTDSLTEPNVQSAQPSTWHLFSKTNFKLIAVTITSTKMCYWHEEYHLTTTGRFHSVIKNHSRGFMSFSNGFDLHSPSPANGDHYEHAKKENPTGALPWAKTNIKISRWKMDIFHLALAHKMKGRDSKPFNTFSLFFPFLLKWEWFFFLAHYHSLIRRSSV